MAGLTYPTGLYGLWSFCFKDRVTMLPQAFFKAIGEYSFTNEADMEDFVAGGDKFVRASEPKYFKADGAIMIKEFLPKTYQYLGGATSALGIAEPTGAVTALAPAQGTSIIAATGLIVAALTSGATADLKFGNYTIVATSASAVDVYCDSDIDFGGVWTNGTVETFQNDNLKITATPLSISEGTTVPLPGFGIGLTAGASVTAFTIGDTATFSVRPANVANSIATIGDRNTFLKTYHVTAYAAPKGITGEITCFDMPIVQPSGVGSIGLKELSWVTASPKIKVLRSETLNYAVKVTTMQRMFA
jgi:hypothetical protein